MIALNAVKFTFKNFTRILPYFITPFLLVTLGTALGLSPLVFKNEVSIVLALIGLVVMLVFFWSYIVKSAGVYSLINGLILSGQVLPYEGLDKNIKERSGKYIKFLLYYALLSILIISPFVIFPFFLNKVNLVGACIVYALITVFVVWAFVHIIFATAAFTFNDFDDAVEPIAYSYKLARGNVFEVCWEFFVFNLLLQLICFLVVCIPCLLFDIFMTIKAADLASKVLSNLVASIINFAAFPILITMLYKKYGGEFTHPDWLDFEKSQNS